MTNKTQMEDTYVDTDEVRAAFDAIIDEARRSVIDRVKFLIDEYDQADHQFIVDLLSFAAEKGIKQDFCICNSLMHFYGETREGNLQDETDFSRKKQASHVIQEFFAWDAVASCERRKTHAMKAKRAIRNNITGLSYTEAIGDSICDMLHFFVDQGKNPAELLCRAIEVFAFDVSKQPRNDEAFEKLRAAIHEYIEDAMLIVAD